MNNRWKSSLTLLLCLVASVCARGQSAGILTLAMDDAFQSQFHKTGHYQWLRQALLAQGYDFRLVWMPNRRAMVEANAGHIDGDLHKQSFMAARFDNLVRVEEPFFYACVVAYGAPQDLPVRNIGVLKGLEFVNHLLPKQSDKYQFHTIERLAQGVDMVHYGRLQALLLPAVVSDLLPASELRGLQVISPSLMEYPTYIHLNRRHASLAKRLQRQLRETRPANIKNRCGQDSLAVSRLVSLE